MGRIIVVLTAASVLVLARTAEAKETHLEHVRALLVSKAARCTSCHTGADGAALNAYGKRLGALGKSTALGDRIARFESDRDDAGKKNAARAEHDEDIDQDGVPNWIEILADKSPADATEKPDAATVKRIDALVSCTLCHKQTNLPGKTGLAANPHNAFGDLLAKTFPRKRGQRPPKSQTLMREEAERTAIIARINLVAKKRARGSRVTYWEKLRLLTSPSDAKATPDLEAIKAFKTMARRQRRKSTRDATLGLDVTAHPATGILADAKTLP